MASVYILHSMKLDRYYIGSCKTLSYRLSQHLQRVFEESFTAKADDWELFFSIDDLSYNQARGVELHIKKRRSKKYYQSLKQYPEIADRLKKRYK